MKASDLRKLYLSVINLYGFVFSDELFEILDHYGISYKKEQILKDLLDRSTKMTRGYAVEEIDSSNYIIYDFDYTGEELEKLYSFKKGKKRYYPKTYEYLLQYSNYYFKDEKDQNAFNNLFQFLRRHSKESESKLSTLIDVMIISIKKSIDLKINQFFELLDLFDIEFPNQKTVEKFLNIIQNVANDVRIPSNNGFTPIEMQKMAGPIDMNNVALSIGPNMRRDFLSGKLDPYKFLSDLDNYNLPPAAKESFRKELLEIIEEIERNK